MDAPNVVRLVIEDSEEGYEKTLELYTLHIVPKLEQWEYAKELLDYESELTSQRREVKFASNLLGRIFGWFLKKNSISDKSLNPLYTQAMTARHPFKAVPLQTSVSPRSGSPAPSCSSPSSSLSNTSTHTVIPSTHRGNRSSDGSTLTSLSQTFSSLLIKQLHHDSKPRASLASSSLTLIDLGPPGNSESC